MIKELLNLVGKANPRPLLITFVGLSITTFLCDDELLSDPFRLQTLALPIFVFIAYLLVWMWTTLVRRLNSSLADNDIANWSLMLGCSLLAFCILTTFSFISFHPSGLSSSLLVEPNFIRLCAMFLLAVETINIKRIRGHIHLGDKE